MNLKAAFKSGLGLFEFEPYDTSDFDKWNDVLFFPIINRASGERPLLGRIVRD